MAAAYSSLYLLCVSISLRDICARASMAALLATSFAIDALIDATCSSVKLLCTNMVRCCVRDDDDVCITSSSRLRSFMMSSAASYEAVPHRYVVVATLDIMTHGLRIVGYV
jgi:hypothetical protein